MSNFMIYNPTSLWTKGAHKEGDYQYFVNISYATRRTQAGAVGLQAVVSGCTLLEGINALTPID
jgi:hypothetical protein